MCTHMYTLIYTETHVKAPNFYEIEASGHKLFLLKKKYTVILKVVPTASHRC